jgi:uncharacterized protein YdiU (UPF0061 family)
VRQASDVINGFPLRFERAWLSGMRTKLGLIREEADDMELAVGLLSVLETQNADFTRVFRSLSKAASGEAPASRSLFANPAGFDVWLPLWQARLEREDAPADEKIAAMNGANPVYIPRNHMVEAALESAAPGVTLRRSSGWSGCSPTRSRSAGAGGLCTGSALGLRALHHLLRHLSPPPWLWRWIIGIRAGP